MSTLRGLVFATFIAGMTFDSFFNALFKHQLGNELIFIALTIFELWYALKLYDQAKVKK